MEVSSGSIHEHDVSNEVFMHMLHANRVLLNNLHPHGDNPTDEVEFMLPSALKTANQFDDETMCSELTASIKAPNGKRATPQHVDFEDGSSIEYHEGVRSLHGAKIGGQRAPIVVALFKEKDAQGTARTVAVRGYNHLPEEIASR